MSGRRTAPLIDNPEGLRVVDVEARELMCMGAPPPHDHPHIYLDMGASPSIRCPYCSTLFRFVAATEAAKNKTPQDGGRRETAHRSRGG